MFADISVVWSDNDVDQKPDPVPPDGVAGADDSECDLHEPTQLQETIMFFTTCDWGRANGRGGKRKEESLCMNAVARRRCGWRSFRSAHC